MYMVRCSNLYSLVYAYLGILVMPLPCSVSDSGDLGSIPRTQIFFTIVSCL